MKRFLALLIIFACTSCAPISGGNIPAQTANDPQISTPETSTPVTPDENVPPPIPDAVRSPNIIGPLTSPDHEVETYILQDPGRNIVCYIVNSAYAANLHCVVIPTGE